MKKFRLWVYPNGKSEHFDLDVIIGSEDKHVVNSAAITKAEEMLKNISKKSTETFEAELLFGPHKPVCWWEAKNNKIKILHNFNKR